MKTLGIDMSSMPPGTAACLIEWGADGPKIEPPKVGCDDTLLDRLIKSADAIGIDAPFGWPVEFVEAVREWRLAEWNPVVRDRLRYRETDRYVRDQFKLSPLSVSSDRISLPTMRVRALLKRHGVRSFAGSERFFEVYPAGTLEVWRIVSEHSYKKENDESRRARRAMLEAIRRAVPWLEIPEEYAATSDTMDALVAALTTREAAQGRTFLPSADQARLAEVEGWIHLPTGLPPQPLR